MLPSSFAFLSLRKHVGERRDLARVERRDQLLLDGDVLEAGAEEDDVVGAEAGGADLVHRLLLVGVIVDVDLDAVFLLERWQREVDVVAPAQDVDLAADLVLGQRRAPA